MGNLSHYGGLVERYNVRLDVEHGKFKGYVELPEFMNLEQVRQFEESLTIVDKKKQEGVKTVELTAPDEKRLPVLLSVVTEWHIENIPEKPTLKTFPMTPAPLSHALVWEIYQALLNIWKGEDVPKD